MPTSFNPIDNQTTYHIADHFCQLEFGKLSSFPKKSHGYEVGREQGPETGSDPKPQSGHTSIPPHRCLFVEHWGWGHSLQQFLGLFHAMVTIVFHLIEKKTVYPQITEIPCDLPSFPSLHFCDTFNMLLFSIQRLRKFATSWELMWQISPDPSWPHVSKSGGMWYRRLKQKNR